MRRRKLPAKGIEGLRETHAVREWDASGAVSKAEILKEIGEVWSFPSYYGANWDALIDCLSDLSWIGGNRFAFVIYHGHKNPDWSTLLECLDDVSDRWGPDGAFDVYFVG